MQSSFHLISAKVVSLSARDADRTSHGCLSRSARSPGRRAASDNEVRDILEARCTFVRHAHVSRERARVLRARANVSTSAFTLAIAYKESERKTGETLFIVYVYLQIS